MPEFEEATGDLRWFQRKAEPMVLQQRIIVWGSVGACKSYHGDRWRDVPLVTEEADNGK